MSIKRQRMILMLKTHPLKFPVSPTMNIEFCAAAFEKEKGFRFCGPDSIVKFE